METRVRLTMEKSATSYCEQMGPCSRIGLAVGVDKVFSCPVAVDWLGFTDVAS